MNNVFHYTMPTSLIGLLSRIRLNENIDRSMLVKCPCTSSSATPTTHTSTAATFTGYRVHVVATVLLYVQRSRTVLPYVLQGIVQYLFQRQENVASRVRRSRCKALDCRCQGDTRWWHSVMSMLKACLLWWWSCKNECRINEKQQPLVDFLYIISSHTWSKVLYS